MSGYNWPTGVLETKFGPINFARTQASHVALNTHSGEFIQVHGVFYHVALHLHLAGDTWKKKQEESLYLNRDWSEKNGNKPASHAAYTAVLNELTRVWCEYAAANPEQSDLAERSKLTRDVDNADEEIAELTDRLAKAKAARSGINAALRKAGGRIE